MTTTQRRSHPRLLACGVGAVGLAVVLAGCASGSSSSAASPSAAPSRAARTGQVPGTSGTIAAASPGSLEVQNPTDGQVTVTYTGATTFTDTVTATAAAAAVGSCVTASATPTGATTHPSASSGTGAAARPSAFTATAVVVSAATGGSCTNGSGQRPTGSGSGGERPTGVRPSGASGRGGGFAGFGDRASGTVTAVSGDVLTVAVPAQGNRPASTDTVTTTASTVFTQVESGTSADATVGRCVLAIGTADSTGAVAATRIAVSTPGADGCTTGFGRRGGSGA